MDTRLRLTLAASLCLLPLLPLTIRLADLQVMEHRDLETRAAGEFSRSWDEAAPRADILDRNGNVLAQSLPSWSVFIDKSMVKSPGSLAAKLGPLVQMPPPEILRRHRAQGRFAWVKTGLGFEEMSAVSQGRLEGVGIAANQDRFYPNEGLARNVLGMLSGEGKGVSGVELSQDGRLTGEARRFKVIRDGSGRTIYRGAGKNAPAPEPLRLTLDRNIQYYAEQMLREAAARFSMKSGLIAVQDPSNGEILAMAAYPGTPLKNPIVQDTYEPGSTFKVVAAAAALEESVVSPAETFFCENGAYEVAPHVVIHDHEPQGSLTLSGILEQSSNIGISKVAERLGAIRFYRASRAFGFANRTGVPLPGETGGDMKPLSDMTKIALAASSYGYGIGVSALQVLGAYSAIANGGILWEPRLVKDGRGPGKVRRVASERTMATLREMLEGVVERGTGTAARIAGYRAAGKTGTARKLDPATRKYSTSLYNASFAGFLPASRPLWTILIVIEDPKGQYYGAQVAAPVFAKLGRQLLALRGVPPDRPLDLRADRPAHPGLPRQAGATAGTARAGAPARASP